MTEDLAKPLALDVLEDEIFVQGRHLRPPFNVSDLEAALGKPDRISSGTPAAPPGHRNNEAYIYDSYGFYLLRQHDSDQLLSLTAVFRQSDGPLRVPFVPKFAFCGEIRLPGITVSATTTDIELRAVLQESKQIRSENGVIDSFHVSFIVSTAKQMKRQRVLKGNLACVSVSFRRLARK